MIAYQRFIISDYSGRSTDHERSVAKDAELVAMASYLIAKTL